MFRFLKLLLRPVSKSSKPVLVPTLPGVYRLNLPWVNVWILANEGRAVMIDTGIRWDRKAIDQALEDIGAKLEAVLLTHAHPDHAGNAAYLTTKHDAELACHQDERIYMATRRTYIPRGAKGIGPSGWVFALGEVAWPVKRRTPETVLNDGDIVETPIGPLEVIHLPGHTPGLIGFLSRERSWLFSGDALINVIPFKFEVGLTPPVPLFSTDVAQGLRSIQRIADLKVNTLFPGHGPSILEGAAGKIDEFLVNVSKR
jgi:glyoxylase-like metal-dependent hydrolase (beta-lactamase superfamily II)